MELVLWSLALLSCLLLSVLIFKCWYIIYRALRSLKTYQRLLVTELCIFEMLLSPAVGYHHISYHSWRPQLPSWALSVCSSAESGWLVWMPSLVHWHGERPYAFCYDMNSLEMSLLGTVVKKLELGDISSSSHKKISYTFRVHLSALDILP